MHNSRETQTPRASLHSHHWPVDFCLERASESQPKEKTAPAARRMRYSCTDSANHRIPWNASPAERTEISSTISPHARNCCCEKVLECRIFRSHLRGNRYASRVAESPSRLVNSTGN